MLDNLAADSFPKFSITMLVAVLATSHNVMHVMED